MHSLHDSVAHALLSALNHLIAGAPWAQARLAPFAGRTLRLAAPPLQLLLNVDKDGYFATSGLDLDSEPCDVTIDLPAIGPGYLLNGPEALLGEARIAGTADFADAVGFVLRNLRWDHEEDLSRLVGDLAAHRLSKTASQLFDWQRQAGHRLAENLVEYWRDEQAVLSHPDKLQDFTTAVARLDNDIAELERRLDRLKR
ncbi:MAG: hypothetical protein KUL75_00510 [Sterolibacterium sp.]|nr:hypothetical protein [Sterolibacterium sp.]